MWDIEPAPGRLPFLQVWAAVLWGALAAAVALTALRDVNGDARVLVGTASVVLPATAVAGDLAIHRDRRRLAAVLLLISALSPTYFAWALNLIPLVIAASLALPAHTSRTHR